MARGAAHRGGAQRLSRRRRGRRARGLAAARGVSFHGGRVRRQISAGATLRPRAGGLLAGSGVSPAALRLFRRRHLRPRGAVAARERDRLCRSGMAAPRVHQRAWLQLEFGGQRRHARVARTALARVDPSLAAGDAVVRHVPLPRRFRRQRVVLAGRGPVGRRGRALRADRARRHAMPHAGARGCGAAHLWCRDRAASRDASGAECEHPDASAGRAQLRPDRYCRGAGPAGAGPRAPPGAAARARGDHARHGVLQRCELSRRGAPVRQRRRRIGL